MSDFNNRMSAQRAVLRLVNAQHWDVEDLCGLSSKAIERWVSANRLDVKSRLVNLVTAASEKLFFLANKSQEQMTDQYKAIAEGFLVLVGEIESEMSFVRARSAGE
jgi:hypothetical protein